MQEQRLTRWDREKFRIIIGKATRSELDTLNEILQDEIRLSELSISEGCEKRI